LKGKQNKIKQKMLELEQEKIKIEKENFCSETHMKKIKMHCKRKDIYDNETKEFLKIIKD
jgi:hypothetical protein